MEWSAKGQEYLQNARRLHHMALDYFRRREHGKAIDNLLDALKLRQYALPPSHPQVIATLEFLLHVMSHVRPVTEQLPFMQQQLEAKRQRFGNCHLETEQAMSLLASAYEQLGRKTEAEALNTEIWRIRAMSNAQRQAVDFDESFSSLQLRQRKKAPSLNMINEEDMFKPIVRTSKFVENDEWMNRLKIMMKTKPEEREALKAKWDAEDRERQMQKLFSADFNVDQSHSAEPENIAENEPVLHDGSVVSPALEASVIRTPSAETPGAE